MAEILELECRRVDAQGAGVVAEEVLQAVARLWPAAKRVLSEDRDGLLVDVRRAVVLVLHGRGFQVREIAEALKRTSQTVSYHLREGGVP